MKRNVRHLVLAGLLLLPMGATAAPATAPLAMSGLAGAASINRTAPPSGEDPDNLVGEFIKYFKKYEDSATRVEAILALEDVEDAGVVRVLVPVLKLEDKDVVQAAVRVLSGFKTSEPIEAFLVALEEEKKEPTRLGLLRALAAGRYGGADKSLEKCLKDRRSWRVRRAGVLALAAGPSEGAAELIVKLAGDREPAVRCAVLDSLAERGSGLVLEPAAAGLDDAVWQVRASAISALARVRRTNSVPLLIAQMAREEGRLAADVAAALESLTGRAFGQRRELWERFWETYKERYEIPTDEELAKLLAAKKARAEEYSPPGAVSYHGISTPSRSILFVIDVSGSMENMVVEREKFAEGGYPSMQRLDIVKTELARTIERLEPYVKFNVIAFATKIEHWKKRQQKANALGRSSAADWVRNLEAIGGNSKETYSAVGLAGAANLEGGKTNTYGALMAALGIDPDPKSPRTGDYQIELDTIFFLSDGRPSTGQYIDSADILREFTAANATCKVVLHTIAIGEFRKQFMKDLAKA
ncbi:MAG: HEAT repeat domain-containing protein, partial [Planctomycetota bacterium]|nr:HEAT repeat domain-containing protein [Planctomycetota bacterium]